jgi:hypothetical protein
MKIISVDIGWRNLAFIVAEVEDNDLKIIEWGVINILIDEEANVNQTSVEDLIRLTGKNLRDTVNAWIEFKPEKAFLETQPMGLMARNVKTKILSHVIQAFFLADGIPVQFISPKTKLKGMETSGSYSENKKFAVIKTREILSQYNLKEWSEKYELSGKKDDLADAFLQGYYAVKMGDKKPKKTLLGKRKKRDAHQETEKIVGLELNTS